MFPIISLIPALPLAYIQGSCKASLLAVSWTSPKKCCLTSKAWGLTPDSSHHNCLYVSVPSKAASFSLRESTFLFFPPLFSECTAGLQLLRAAVDNLGEGTVSLCGFVFPQDNNPDTVIVKTLHFNPWSVWGCFFHSGLPSSHSASAFEAKVPPGHHTVLGKSSHLAEVALQNNQIFQSSGWTFLKYLGKSAWSCQEFLFLTGTSMVLSLLRSVLLYIHEKPSRSWVSWVLAWDLAIYSN